MTNQIDKAPAGATHRYEHAGLVSWYREVDGNMFTWRDGSWFASFFKSSQDLAQSCMLGKVTPLVADTAQQVDDDLTWLVRETKGEWHGMATHIARDGADDYLWACAIHLMAEYPNHNWFSKAKYLARKAELQNKPSWKDAPEWATALTQDSAMEDGLGAWWWHEFAPTECERTWSSQGRAYPAKERGEVLGDWRDTLEQRPEAASESPVDMAIGIIGASDITRMPIAEGVRSHADQEATHTAMLYCDLMRRLRSNPEHLDAEEFAALHQLCDAELTKRDAAVCGGEKQIDVHRFERGELPPVGAVCEYTLGSNAPWYQCEIKYVIRGDGVVMKRISCGTEQYCSLYSKQPVTFRPIRTDADRLKDLLTQAGITTCVDEAAEAILSEGFKRGQA